MPSGNSTSIMSPDKDDDRSTFTTGDIEHGSQEVILSRRAMHEAAEDPSYAGKANPLCRRRRLLLAVLLTVSAGLAVSLAFVFIRGGGPNYSGSVGNGDDGNVSDSSDTGTSTPIGEDGGSLESDFSETKSPIVSRPDEDQTTANDDLNGGDNTLTDEENESNNSDPPTVPFENVDLPFFSTELTQGYENKEDFEKDLTEAAKFYVNNFVLKNLGLVSTPTGGGGGGWGPNLPMNSKPTMTWRGADTTGESENSFRDVTEFETNNQEQGIAEADFVQADENFIYAAYNDYILVWDTAGNQIAQAYVGMASTETEHGATPLSGIFSGGGMVGTQEEPRVESLLLAGDYLVVIVSAHDFSNESGARAVLTDLETTVIRTYSIRSITTDQELTLVGTRNVNGRFLDARALGNQVHIVTSSGIDTYTHLGSPFDRYRDGFVDMSDQEYIAVVKQQALDIYIPRFVRKFSEELSIEDTRSGKLTLPNMLQINRWQELGTLADKQGRSQLDAQVYSTGVVTSVTLITSLDVTASPLVDSSEGNPKLPISTSSLLAPSQLTQAYTTDSNLVLTVRAWSWNSNTESMQEVTHLILLNIGSGETVGTSFRSVGTIQGFLLNSYSVDIVNNELRVATTVSKQWRFQPRPLVTDNTVEVNLNMSRSQSSVTIQDRAANVEQGGSQVVEESITENYITALEMDNELQQQRFVSVGEPNERILAVRFFDKIAYCVTALQTDPFYVVDMETLHIMGSYKLNGFSNYLHPLNDDGTMIVGIGQNTTADGASSDFLITVFNATDPTRPEALVSYTVTGDSESSSSSSVAQWDYKSFRYVDGKLILPLEITSYSFESMTADAIRQTLLGIFRGFVVFNVSATGISEHFRVSHAAVGCHYCGHLAPRSFVYDGNVMTVQDNRVASTNLDSAEENWAFQVQVYGETASCCF